MKSVYRAYRLVPAGVALLSLRAEEEQRATGLLSPEAELLWEIAADTPDEACAIHFLRMGFGAYQPVGVPSSCPQCGAIYYPESSNYCWRCGPVI